MLFVLAIAGCSSDGSTGKFVKPDLPGEAVPYSVVAHHAIPEMSPRVVAGTSLDTLLAQYMEVPNGQGEAACAARWGGRPCLGGIAVPSKSFLILVLEPRDCFWVGRVSGVHRSGSALLVGVEVATTSCPPGSAMVAAPSLSLVAVSLDVGPASTASVIYGGDLSSLSQSAPIRLEAVQVS
jgi:hypothetical protein